MPIVLDHTIVPAHDNEASARFFAHIFGLQVEAAVSHFAPVRVFGSGTTRLQPAHVEDVAEAIARILQGTEWGPKTLECGGPRVYTYKELLRSIAREAGRKPIRTAAILPSPPITRNQLELMQIDTVVSPQLPGFAELGILPQPLDETVRLIVRNG
jgi:NADH dehydrogenase